MGSRGIGSNEDRIHTYNPPFVVGNFTAIAKAKHWTGGACQRHGTIWRPGRNLSAALGLNGGWAFGPVGGFLAASDPPGGVATAYNLLTSSLNANAPDCAGQGTYEPHAPNTPCPAVFRQHPDWFTCGAGSSHGPCTPTSINRTDNGQPCWSAPGVVETMTKNVLKILRADPTIKIISVSNMDGGVSFAPCPMDMVAAAKENATGGANFYAVRDIAAAVAQEFPHVKIQALAVSQVMLRSLSCGCHDVCCFGCHNAFTAAALQGCFLSACLQSAQYNGAKAPPKYLRFAHNVIVQIAGIYVGSSSRPWS